MPAGLWRSTRIKEFLPISITGLVNKPMSAGSFRLDTGSMASGRQNLSKGKLNRKLNKGIVSLLVHFPLSLPGIPFGGRGSRGIGGSREVGQP
jgi:hypothetical protein